MLYVKIKHWKSLPQVDSPACGRKPSFRHSNETGHSLHTLTIDAAALKQGFFQYLQEMKGLRRIRITRFSEWAEQWIHVLEETKDPQIEQVSFRMPDVNGKAGHLTVKETTQLQKIESLCRRNRLIHEARHYLREEMCAGRADYNMDQIVDRLQVFGKQDMGLSALLLITRSSVGTLLGDRNDANSLQNKTFPERNIVWREAT